MGRGRGRKKGKGKGKTRDGEGTWMVDPFSKDNDAFVSYYKVSLACAPALAELPMWSLYRCMCGATAPSARYDHAIV